MAHKNPKAITFKTGSHADRFEKQFNQTSMGTVTR